MYCPNCGTACDNARFCPSCGTEVAAPIKHITQEATLGDGTRVQQTTSVAPLPNENAPSEASNKREKSLIRELLEGALTLVAIGGLVWFWNLPSREDIEKEAQKVFLELCDENDWAVTDADIKEFTLVSESWPKTYSGFAQLEAKAGEKVQIPFTVTVDNGWQEYRLSLSVEPLGVLSLNVHFSEEE